MPVIPSADQALAVWTPTQIERLGQSVGVPHSTLIHNSRSTPVKWLKACRIHWSRMLLVQQLRPTIGRGRRS